MGAPYFKYESICKANNVKVLSSNYPLYGDISNRIMNTLKGVIPDVEIYSIDEAFIRLDNLPETDLVDFCKKIYAKILQDIGVPTSIGIGTTKTLAKIANHYAKKNKSNVFAILNKATCDLILND